MAFEPITTQEQFDAAISERIRRERDKFAGFDEYKSKAESADALQKQLEKLNADLEKARNELASANQKIGDLPTQLNEATTRAKMAERTNLQYKIAHETGLPFELAGKLSGDTEDEMRNDAQNMAPYLQRKTDPAPLFQNDKTGTDDPYKKLLDTMKG